MRRLTIFLKSSTVIFVIISAWCQSLRVFQFNNFRKWLNTTTWLNHRKQFFKVSRLFSHIMQSVLLVLLLYFKKAGIQFKHNGLKTKNINFESIPPYSWTYSEVTPLFIKWMTSRAHNNNILLLPLQIWKQPHRWKF